MKDSTFTRPDIARAVAARLGDGATVATVDRVTARVLASPQVVPVERPHRDRRGGESGPLRWTSTTHLAIEL